MLAAIIERQRFAAQAMASAIAKFEGVEAITLDPDAAGLAQTARERGVNIMLFCFGGNSDGYPALMAALASHLPSARQIALLPDTKGGVPAKIIKAGAKGILGPAADLNELYRALLTVRGGYEYYSQEIEEALLANYMEEPHLANGGKPSAEETLSPRQIEILRLWGQNHSNKEIAEKLFLSVRTVETHKNHIMQRLNLKTTVDMIKYGIRNNIIEL